MGGLQSSTGRAQRVVILCVTWCGFNAHRSRVDDEQLPMHRPQVALLLTQVYLFALLLAA